MSLSVQMFAFNASIAKELKERLAARDEAGRSVVFGVPFKFAPSKYQQDIFDWIKNGRGSAIVDAKAGSGKTTTIMMGLRFIPGVEERSVSASTFHSVGLRAVTKRLGVRNDQVRIDAGKVRKIARDALGDAEYEVYGDFCVRLVALAKGQGVGSLVPNEGGVWWAMIKHHDLFLDDEMATEERAIEIARQLLRISDEVAKSRYEIDFDDMLHLPLLWGCRFWQNDWVIVDESQDTNPVRRAIAKGSLRPGGRLLAVGDPKQAIYGFTGASHDAMDLIREEFNCRVFPLNVSYRCPKAVAEKVHPLVPDFEVPPTAIQGEVRAMTVREAMAVFDSKDLVICRQTAPLIELAFSLIANGTGCHVLGKEIGAGLVNLIKRQKAKGIEHLVAKLEFFRDREVAKHMAKGEEGKAEAVADRIACITTVVEHLDENRRTIPALIERLEGMFSDTNGVLTLATVHKVKGREHRRVAVLRPELMPSKWARQEHQYQQELNLQYVGWTRAQELLVELTDATLGPAKKPEVKVEEKKEAA